MQRSIPLGKWRRLQQTASRRGAFAVLAVDHRGPLRRRLARECASQELDRALAALKADIVRELAPFSSAVLLDPAGGLQACIPAGALPGATGLIVARDTGSTGDPAVLKSSLVQEWDAARIVSAGAAGAKLLVYYHPDAPDAEEVEQLVAATARDCARHELPFFLEPLSYSPRCPGEVLRSAERRRVVIESARRLVPAGVDILKAEFPVDVSEEPDPAVWRDACYELSANCSVPWVLLSAGVTYEVFLRQATAACEAGASGVMAGRAVWKEAVTADADARRSTLREIARDRMARLRSLCDALALPFTAKAVKD
jgi:tagatose-1,6-bisphosphate aldolase